MGVITNKLAIVFGDHHHDVASFGFRGPNGDFTAQFADLGDGDYVWNIADSPPTPTSDHGFAVRETGNRYILLESTADNAHDARGELNELRLAYGGHHTSITGRRTFESFKGSPSLTGLLSGLKRRLLRGVA